MPILYLPEHATEANNAAWTKILHSLYQENVEIAEPRTPIEQIFAPLLRLNDDVKHIVFGQIGQSLDGRIATVSGHSHYINGPSALIHLHRLRAVADAVVVGIGTVMSDDPQLTVRHVTGSSPARVILDPQGRLPKNAKCLRNDGARRIVVRARVNTAEPQNLEDIEVITIPADRTGIPATAIVHALSDRGLRRIFVEGGADTISRFLAAGALDRLHILLAPMLIGSGINSLTLPQIDTLDAALRPRTRLFDLGDGDVLFDCSFEEEVNLF